MQIVFLNTFEKPAEQGRVIGAQLSIGEERGIWAVHWLETSEPGAQPETWFEGTSWEEMLTSFRHGVARMMGAGFLPVIDGMLENERNSAGRHVSMLQCYGELHASDELFKPLREWRRKTAAAEKKSAYLVATNRLLWMISAFVPQTEEELLQIPGWGENKHAAYGAAILEITAGVARSTSFPLDWVADQLDEGVFASWLFKQKGNKYKSMLDRQEEKKRILAFLRQGGPLKQLEEELSLPRRELLLRIEGLEQEGYDVEPFIEQALGEVPESEQQLIMSALREKGDRYLKPVMEQVYGTTEEARGDQPLEQLYERLRFMRMRFRRNRGERAV